MMSTKLYGLSVGLGGVVFFVAIFFASLLNFGERTVSPLTNIQGIPYPSANNKTQIYEALAHVDIALIEPVLGKQAQITVTFIPHDTKQLSLGIRRNGFWLSYQLESLYDVTQNLDRSGPITAQLTIPLTDKFQDQDHSLDLMFFAADERPVDPTTLLASPAYWELQDIEVEVLADRPGFLELLNYASSIVLRERAL